MVESVEYTSWTTSSRRLGCVLLAALGVSTVRIFDWAHVRPLRSPSILEALGSDEDKLVITTSSPALTTSRSLPRQSAFVPPSWGQDDIVVVPCVYTKWGTAEPGSDALFPERPAWARDSNSSRHKVHLYQRLFPERPNYVPNFGFEGAVYLRFIVDHYGNLPAVMVFVQDDYPWCGFEDCFSRNLTYYDLSAQIAKRPYQTRGTSFWAGRLWGVAVEQCWRDFADIFQLDGFQRKKEPKVRFHPGNYFAVGRGTVQRRPFSQWRAAYKKAVSQKCHNGPLDRHALSDTVLAYRPGTLWDRYGWTKHTSGGALEHLRDMIYGFYPMAGKAQKQHPCDAFIPRSQCPGSLCMS